MRPITASPFGWPEGFGPGSASTSSRAPSGASLAGPAPRWTTGRYLGGHSPDVHEAERVLSHVAAARDRAEQARRAMRRSSADRTLLEAVDQAERSLRAVQRALVSALDGPGAGPMATA